MADDPKRSPSSEDTPSSAPMQLPCKVCGEHGTGFHYGVTSCGACKGFFRRSIVRQEPYVCTQSRLCTMGPSTDRRQSCPKCRYDKCIAVGMSREACKIGRYTLLKKSKDIEEAKKFHQSSQLSQQSSVSNQTSNEEQLDSMDEDSPRSITHDTVIQTDGLKTDPLSGNPTLENTKTLCTDGQSSNTNDDDTITNYLRREDFSLQNWDEDPSPVNPSVENILDHETNTSRRPGNNKSNTLGRNQYQPSSSGSPLCSTKHESYWNMPATSSCVSIEMNSPYTSTTNISGSPVNNGNGVVRRQEEITTNENHTFPNSLQKSNNSGQCYPTSNQNKLGLKSANVFSNDNHSCPASSSQNSDQNSFVLNTPKESTSTQFSSPVYSTINDINILPNAPTSSTVNPQLFQKPAGTGFVESVHQLSPDSTNTMTESPALGYFEGLGNFDHFSPDSFGSNKRFEQTAEECPCSSKKHRLSEDTDMSQLYRGQTNNLVPALNQDNHQECSHFTLCIGTPDPMKYNLSVFDRFPFRCFEKESIGPLLKMCYESNDWIEEFLSQPNDPDNRVWSNYEPRGSTEPLRIQMSSAFHSEDIPGQHTSAEGLAFDYDELEMEGLLTQLKNTHLRYYGPESAFLSASEMKKYQEMFVVEDRKFVICLRQYLSSPYYSSVPNLSLAAQKICQLHDSLKGKLNLTDDDKYVEILEATEVDYRKKWFCCIADGFNDSFIRDSNFFRALPGFRQLSLKDRISITKVSYPFLSELRHNRTTDFENGVCIDQERGVVTRTTTYQRMIPGFHDFFDEWLRVNKDLQGVNLTFEEMIVLNTVFIMVPDDVEGLENPELVKHWQDTYLACLLHLMRQRLGATADARFQAVLDLIQGLKSFCTRKLKKNGVALADAVKRLAAGQEHLMLMQEVLAYWGKSTNGRDNNEN